MTTDTDRCSRLWFTLTASETNIVSLDRVNPVTNEVEKVYFNWIKQVEEELANSFETGH
jgi:hypothetical protein